jgi:quaternary ammonium compound-resistance protein SugE
MAWVCLFIAAVFEVGWAIGLKYTHGFTKLGPSVLTIAAMVVSMTLLAIAVKTIPIGTGYAIWTGIGAVGAALLGIWLFGESASAWRLSPASEETSVDVNIPLSRIIIDRPTLWSRRLGTDAATALPRHSPRR